MLFQGVNMSARKTIYQYITSLYLIMFSLSIGISATNRWQPLALELFEGQAVVLKTKYLQFLNPEFSFVAPFSLLPSEIIIYERNENINYFMSQPTDYSQNS